MEYMDEAYLGYLDPTKAKLRIPFEFVPPVTPTPALEEAPKPKPKTKPKQGAKQLSTSAFVKKN